MNSSGGELALQLPLASVGDFPALLEQLEADVQRTNDNGDDEGGRVGGASAGRQQTQRQTQQRTLGVTGFGLSVTSLEEVFLRLNNDDEEEGEDDETGAHKAKDRDDDAVHIAVRSEESVTGNDDGDGDDGAGGDEAQQKNKEQQGDDVEKAVKNSGAAETAVDDGSSTDVGMIDLDKGVAGTVNIWNVEPAERSCTRQWRTMILKRWINFQRDIKVRRACVCEHVRACVRCASCAVRPYVCVPPKLRRRSNLTRRGRHRLHLLSHSVTHSLFSLIHRNGQGIIFQVMLPVVFIVLIMLTLTADISPVGE